MRCYRWCIHPSVGRTGKLGPTSVSAHRDPRGDSPLVSCSPQSPWRSMPRPRDLHPTKSPQRPNVRDNDTLQAWARWQVCLRAAHKVHWSSHADELTTDSVADSFTQQPVAPCLIAHATPRTRLTTAHYTYTTAPATVSSPHRLTLSLLAGPGGVRWAITQ